MSPGGDLSGPYRVDPLAAARAAVGASSQSDDLEVASFYLAQARIACSKLREELLARARVLIARERELVVRATPKTQLAIEAKP